MEGRGVGRGDYIYLSTCSNGVQWNRDLTFFCSKNTWFKSDQLTLQPLLSSRCLKELSGCWLKAVPLGHPGMRSIFALFSWTCRTWATVTGSTWLLAATTWVCCSWRPAGQCIKSGSRWSPNCAKAWWVTTDLSARAQCWGQDLSVIADLCPCIKSGSTPTGFGQ